MNVALRVPPVFLRNRTAFRRAKSWGERTVNQPKTSFVRGIAPLLAATAWFLTQSTHGSTPNGERRRPPSAAERSEDQSYRAWVLKLRAQVLDTRAAGNNGDLAKIADQLNRSLDGKLLYLRITHVDEYTHSGGVDVPAKTTVLIDRALSVWRVPIPKSRDTRGTELHVARKTQDGRDYILIESGRLTSGRYADDLSITIAIGTRRPEEWPEGPPAVRQVIAMLERPWQENLSDERLDAAAAALKPLADEAVDEIMRAFNRSSQTFAYRHRAVQILQRLNTKKARATLADIALGRSAEELPSMKQWASAAYLRTTRDRTDVCKLLASDDAGVLGNVLRAIKGIEVDAALLKRLLELTAYKGDKEPMSRESVRCLAAAVMAADPGGKFPTQKVAAIVATTEEVASLSQASKIHWPGSDTYAESSYHHYIQCLSEMRGADEALRGATATAKGPARDILVIARAQRGDAAARTDLLRILDDKQAGMWRAWAVRGLAAIGVPDDLPMLKKLAASDPLERDQGGCCAVPGRKNTHFPVREAAREAIRLMESRASKSS